MENFTEDLYKATLEAYARGVSIVKHGDKTTEFRSQTDMKKLLVAMRKELDKKKGKGPFGLNVTVPGFKQ